MSKYPAESQYRNKLCRACRSECSITVYIKLNIELLYLIGSRLYRQRFEFFFSFLVLHADSTANEDNDEDDDSSRGGSDDDRDNVVTWEQQD